MQHKSSSKRRPSSTGGRNGSQQKVSFSGKQKKALFVGDISPPLEEGGTVETSDLFYSVTFQAGSIGLQLEPVCETMERQVGCRVMRFADGGPKQPGQARKTGKIRPGYVISGLHVSIDNYIDLTSPFFRVDALIPNKVTYWLR